MTNIMNKILTLRFIYQLCAVKLRPSGRRVKAQMA